MQIFNLKRCTVTAKPFNFQFSLCLYFLWPCFSFFFFFLLFLFSCFSSLFCICYFPI
uniref:Uncharacterized protein n=1 Tax=Oryza brachyantha TaxID=4533 RepID=J3MEL4_ORYBR